MPSEQLTPGVHNEWLEAWVVFDRSPRAYPWNVFCRRDMTHCWLFWARYWPKPGPLSTRVTLKSEHTPGGVYSDVAFVTPEEVLALVLENDPTDVLELRVLVQRNTMRYFGQLNCVTVVKAALNLDAPWCLTPSQLHRRLRMMGARSHMRVAT